MTRYLPGDIPFAQTGEDADYEEESKEGINVNLYFKMQWTWSARYLSAHEF